VLLNKLLILKFLFRYYFSYLVLTGRNDFYLDFVTVSKLRFDVLWRSNAFEVSLNHYGQSG